MFPMLIGTNNTPIMKTSDNLRKTLIYGFAHKNTMTLSLFKQTLKLYVAQLRTEANTDFFEKIQPNDKKKRTKKK